MGKNTFKTPPPIKSIKVKVEEWDSEEDFNISELSGLECQEVITAANKVTGGQDRDHGVELYAELLSRCLSSADGDKPSKEWLMSVPFNTLKRLGDQAMKFNNMGPEAEAGAEKN
ncbi:hypothetical protein EHM92_00320 [bacterium]|nr:MAG: hypothetical protein EHM92_00320 [bacterium]